MRLSCVSLATSVMLFSFSFTSKVFIVTLAIYLATTLAIFSLKQVRKQPFHGIMQLVFENISIKWHFILSQLQLEMSG